MDQNKRCDCCGNKASQEFDDIYFCLACWEDVTRAAAVEMERRESEQKQRDNPH